MTDKERLGEIKGYMVILDDSADAADFQRFQEVLINLYKENDIAWLLSTVEEQQKEIEGLQKLVIYHQDKQKEAEDENEPYRHENARLREALKQVANYDFDVSFKTVHNMKQIARKALKNDTRHISK